MVVAQHLPRQKEKKLCDNSIFFPDLNIYIIEAERGWRETSLGRQDPWEMGWELLLSKEKCKVMRCGETT